MDPKGTPITLNSSQLKKSLSAIKKKKKKQVIKNLVSSPYCHYWPAVRPDDALAIQETLKTHLVQLKHSKVNVPWKQITAVPKEERKMFRLDYASEINQNEQIPHELKNTVEFGISAATRLIEKGKASSVLLAEEVKPQFMLNHVLDLCVLMKVPVLVVPNLKEILKQRTGIPSIVISFKTNLESNSKFGIIDQRIKEMHKFYPIDEKHINFYRQNKLCILSGDNNNENEGKEKLDVKNNVKLEGKEDMDIEISDEHEKESEEKYRQNPELKDQEDQTKKTPEEPQDPPKDLLLYRETRKKRVFIPPSSKEHKHEKTGTNPMDFLAFESYVVEIVNDKNATSSDCSSTPQKRKVSYKSLLVKRVTGDSQRSKKKIAKLKKKKK